MNFKHILYNVVFIYFFIMFVVLNKSEYFIPFSLFIAWESIKLVIMVWFNKMHTSLKRDFMIKAIKNKPIELNSFFHKFKKPLFLSYEILIATTFMYFNHYWLGLFWVVYISVSYDFLNNVNKIRNSEFNTVDINFNKG